MGRLKDLFFKTIQQDASHSNLTSNKPQTSSGNLNVTSINGILATSNKLSQEEVFELDSLRQDHAENLKNLKLNHFKNLPKELRQFVINYYTWKKTVHIMNNIQSPFNDRHSALENRYYNSYSPLTNSSFIGHANYSNIAHFGHINHPNYSFDQYDINLPHHISIEDLTKAHLETSLEEELI